MKRYNTLLVEDDAEDIVVARAAAAKLPHINLLVAQSRTEALEIIHSTYLHAAFVDLRLNADNDHDRQGLFVIKDLQQYRPSCRRFLMTAWAHEYRDMVYELLRPGQEQVKGLLNKNDFNQDFYDVLAHLFDVSTNAGLVINGLDVLTSCLQKKRIGVQGRENERVLQLTQDEVREAIEGVLSSTKLGETVKQDIERIDLDLIGGGRSRACVVKGRPVVPKRGEGIWCVIKIGLKNDCLEEVANYCRYLRWTVSINRRVELLAHAALDVIGAVCYTFAHVSPDNVTTLEEFIAEENNQIGQRLITLFDAQHKELYSVVHQADNLGKYFAQTHALDAEKAVEDIQGLLERHSGQWGLARKAQQVYIHDGVKIDVTKLHAVLHRGRCTYLACIVHGDLNASNVLVGIGDELGTRMAVIDYSHTGPGPASFDFAVLQAHLRLITCRNAAPAEILRCGPWERRILKASKSSGGEDLGGKGGDSSEPFWVRTSVTLGRLARANFPDMPDNEMLLTALFWALKMIRNQSLGVTSRLRLIVWANALAIELERPSTP